MNKFTSPATLLFQLGGVLLLLTMTIGGQFSVAAPNLCTFMTAEDYAAAFGRIDPNTNDPPVRKAYEVFERLRPVADNPKTGPFKLIIVKGNNAIAQALPENHVLLTKGAVDLIYANNASSAEIEARMAFVLGHELAHLAHDDLLRHLYSDKCGDEGEATCLKQESTADLKGLTYAGMAGYDVGLLLPPPGSPKTNFLTEWAKMVSAEKLENAVLKKRVENSRARVERVLTYLPFFYFGTRLAHFDRCADGKEFLKQFQQEFPSREVLNNLGFCYLQEARDSMQNPNHSEFYWMPMLLDPESRAGEFTRSGNGYAVMRLGNQPRTARTDLLLREAEFHLKQATMSDPTYWPARVNLAIVDLYLDSPDTARGLLREVESLVPSAFQVELRTLQAVTLYEQSDVDLDLWAKAEERLKSLVKTVTPIPLSAVYDLARLYKIRGRQAKTKAQMDQLIKRWQELPEPIANVVCREQRLFVPGFQCPTSPKQVREYPSFIQWPVPFEWNVLSKQPGVLAALQRKPTESIPVNLSSDPASLSPSSRGHIYYLPNQYEVLELGDYLQMQVVKGNWELEQFQKECSFPLRPRQLPNGNLWTCEKWAVLERDGKVTEVWGVLQQSR